MPSSYDDFTEKASSSYPGGTTEELHNRALLRAAMEKEGYRVEPEEWWHFDYREWRRYPLLDIPFEELPPPVPAAVPALH
jgi:D-alanyl-D-alanine dipeptidase